MQLQETMCSLLFAQRVRAVELGASKKTVDGTEVAALKKRIKELEVRGPRMKSQCSRRALQNGQ